ncbi:MAG: hypothetical protein AAB016_07755 [candidate division NC10 bacterium]
MARRRRSLDLDGIKGRIAEALVESIFRRALYRMTRFGKESDLRGILKLGKDEDFAPDFFALKENLALREAPGVYQTFMIEVKYRADLPRYLALQERGGAKSLLAKSKAKWPNLYVIFVTDRPGEGRSCFQALELRSYEPGGPVKTEPLYEMPALEIYPNNVIEHEELVRQLFGLLASLSAPSR